MSLDTMQAMGFSLESLDPRPLESFKRIHSKDADKFFWIEVVFKISDRAEGQGADRRKSGAYMRVCEHFEEIRNAEIRC
jgi:hypothetical protein